jgi:hypothetical protein
VDFTIILKEAFLLSNHHTVDGDATLKSALPKILAGVLSAQKIPASRQR